MLSFFVDVFSHLWYKQIIVKIGEELLWVWAICAYAQASQCPRITRHSRGCFFSGEESHLWFSFLLISIIMDYIVISTPIISLSTGRKKYYAVQYTLVACFKSNCLFYRQQETITISLVKPFYKKY